jgi:predicted O-methyltransferase YrrM
MKFSEFHAGFGGSFRGKHCKKRGVDLPKDSGLPKEFIRLDPWEGEYLWSVAERASVGVLEIGRCNGGSTFLLACATAAPITSIDIAPRDDGLLRGLFARHRIGLNVVLRVADSRVSKRVGGIDLLFIDGDHSYEGCKADLLTWLPHLADGGDIVFHDCYEGSYGVRRVVEEFAADHPAEFDVIVSPSIGPDHWTKPTGSIAHLRRR